MGGPKPPCGAGELTSQLSLKKVCDSGVKVYLFSNLWKRKQPLCKFFREDPTCGMLAQKPLWAPSTVISRHGFPTEYVRKIPIISGHSPSPEQLKRESVLSTFLWFSQYRVSRELSRNKSPKGSLCCVKPKSVVWCEGFPRGERSQVLWGQHRSSGFRLEIGSKLKEPWAVCNDRTQGCGGEPGGELYKECWPSPPQFQLPGQLLPLCPDQGRRMVPWKTEGHKGPSEAPGNGKYKCCHSLN